MADVRHRSRLGSEHNTTWACCPERTTAMFGRLMIEPVVQLGRGVDLQTSVAALIKVAENVEIFSRAFFFLLITFFFFSLLPPCVEGRSSRKETCCKETCQTRSGE
jgi:hypothetical protein